MKLRNVRRRQWARYWKYVSKVPSRGVVDTPGVERHCSAEIHRRYRAQFQDETEYLLSHTANAEFLRRGVAALDAGQGEEHELIDPDAVGSQSAR